MNNQLPYILYKNNKTEFLNKQCAICLSVLFYPEEYSNNKMVLCSKISCCNHMFHTSCIEQVLNKKCPECRKPFQLIDVKNIDKSLEITIRNDAFDHDEINEELRLTFANECLTIKDYPYHKTVFQRWRKEKYN
jgi:ssDNA-binding Zn-finger/Zn-ribbon topoisomerase 1